MKPTQKTQFNKKKRERKKDVPYINVIFDLIIKTI